MNEIEVGRLVYIVERALFRRLIRPRYNKRQGYRALMRLLTHYRGKVAQLEEYARLLDKYFIAQEVPLEITRRIGELRPKALGGK